MRYEDNYMGLDERDWPPATIESQKPYSVSRMVRDLVMAGLMLFAAVLISFLYTGKTAPGETLVAPAIHQMTER